jgi:hypothetical protein
MSSRGFAIKPRDLHLGRAADWPRPPEAPRWMALARDAAALWALAYGAIRVLWAITGAPSFGSGGTDLALFSGWGAVALCAAVGVTALALTAAPWRRPLLLAACALTAAVLAACALLLLDAVGALLPGMGVVFHPLAFVNRVGCLVGGIALGATAIAYRRRWRSDCMFCGRRGVAVRLARAPWWAWLGAGIALVGCVVRLAAQIAVGFDSSLLKAGGAVVVFEAAFLLAGTVLPLALVHSWGRVLPRWAPVLGARRVPRWLLLGPAFAIAGAMIVYFGITLASLTASTLSGTSTGWGSLPPAFFWVAVPAYESWGLGLGVAALAYYQITRPRCTTCGR